MDFIQALSIVFPHEHLVAKIQGVRGKSFPCFYQKKAPSCPHMFRAQEKLDRIIFLLKYLNRDGFILICLTGDNQVLRPSG